MIFSTRTSVGSSLRIELALFALALTIGLGHSIEAVAYPELTRHGYTSCTSCHASPNGGGLLTPYGRNLSRELLSTWGTPREAEVLHGALPAEWMKSLEESRLRVGGDARWIQTHRENKSVKSGQFFFMQANVEAAWDHGPWVVDLSVGKVEDPRGKGEIRFLGSRYSECIDSVKMQLCGLAASRRPLASTSPTTRCRCAGPWGLSPNLIATTQSFLGYPRRINTSRLS